MMGVVHGGWIYETVTHSLFTVIYVGGWWALRDSNPRLLPCMGRPAQSPDQGKQSETASHQGKRVLIISHHFAMFLNLSRPKRGTRMRTGLI